MNNDSDHDENKSEVWSGVEVEWSYRKWSEMEPPLKPLSQNRKGMQKKEESTRTCSKINSFLLIPTCLSSTRRHLTIHCRQSCRRRQRLSRQHDHALL